MNDDALLASVLRKFLAPTTHPSEHPYIGLPDGELVIDGRVTFTAEEAVALLLAIPSEVDS